MEKILSIIAVVISVIGLVVGGLFNGYWDKQIKKADTSLKVNYIRLLPEVKRQEDRISIPEELQKKSSEMKYAPTLEANMQRDEIMEIINDADTVQSCQISIRAIYEEISQEGVSDEKAASLWNSDLSPDEKAAFFMVKSRRIIREKRIAETSNPSGLEKIVEDLLNDKDATERLRSMTMKEIALLAAKVETNPTKELINKIISDDIQFLEKAVREYSHLSDKLKEILLNRDSGNLRKSINSLEIELTFYNSGEHPDTLIPVAMMAVQKVSGGNIVIKFEPDEAKGNLYIEPKKSFSVKMNSKAGNDKNIIGSLVDIYNSGDRDAIFVLKKVDGDYLTSKPVNFSNETRLSDDEEKSLIEHSKSVPIQKN